MILKKISLLAIGMLCLAGCAKETRFTVNGKIKGGGRDSLFIEEMTEKSWQSRQKLVAGEDGGFSFSDTVSNPRLMFISNPQKEYIMLLIVGGEKIDISAEKGKFSQTTEIAGSPQSSLVMEINRNIVQANDKLDSVYRVYQGMLASDTLMAQQWIQTQYMGLMKAEKAFLRDFIGKHPEDPATLLVFMQKLGNEQIMSPQSEFDLFKKVDENLYAKYPTAPLALSLHRYVAAVSRQMEEAASQVKGPGIGTTVPDISLPDTTGATRTLYSLRGKVVLLDFWASWCGPCRRENPNLVAAYKRYHDKGFEIFQVSLDKTKPAWTAGIRQDGLNWVHVSDLKYWGSPVARQFGIQSIPANFLLDQQGKVIATNLRGMALEDELAKLFQ